MKTFKEVIKEALSYKEAKTAAIVVVVGCIAAAVIPFVIKSSSLQTALLMGICLTVVMFSERLAVIVRIIREEDLKAHGKKVYKDD
jgi:uncharacterized membrane protein (DUF441 family)